MFELIAYSVASFVSGFLLAGGRSTRNPELRLTYIKHCKHAVPQPLPSNIMYFYRYNDDLLIISFLTLEEMRRNPRKKFTFHYSPNLQAYC